MSRRASDDRYVPIRTVQIRIGVSRKTVMKWIGCGALPASQFEGLWRILESDLHAFEVRNKV